MDQGNTKRSVLRKLFKATKENGCEVIEDWMKGIKRHIYWCATSTLPGFGSLIKAKWNFFMRHAADEHTNHQNPLFPNCNHGVLPPRKWIKIGIFLLSLTCETFLKFKCTATKLLFSSQEHSLRQTEKHTDKVPAQ